MSENFKVAVAQIEPVYHDKEGTVEKTCKWIEKAGKKNIDLLVFPEAHIPGYPYWGRNPSSWHKLRMELQKNSISVEDKQIEIISDTIREQNINTVIGVNELDDRVGSETIYNSLFIFDRSGEMIGRHRKLMPTAHERMIWGQGDPSNLDVYKTDIGTIGGLICYENHMTLSKAALTSMGEQIHTAAWPGFWTLYDEKYKRAQDRKAIEGCDIYPAIREYAFETQTFVVSASPYIGEKTPKKYKENFFFNFGAGGSMIVNPFGIVKQGPVLNEEKLVTSHIDLNVRKAIKTTFDSMGHYARWDAVNLNVNDTEYTPIKTNKNKDKIKPFKEDKLEDENLEKIAKEENISTEKLKNIIEKLN